MNFGVDTRSSKPITYSLYPSSRRARRSSNASSDAEAYPTNYDSDANAHFYIDENDKSGKSNASNGSKISASSSIYGSKVRLNEDEIKDLKTNGGISRRDLTDFESYLAIIDDTYKPMLDDQAV